MSAYVLYGDSYLVPRELAQLKADTGAAGLLEGNSHRLQGSQTNLPELLSICNALPFMDARRLVVVEGLLSTLEGRSGRGRRRGRDSQPTSGTLGSWEGLAEAVAVMPETTLLAFLDGPLTDSNPLLRALAPVAQVLNEAVGIDKGFMTTIHSYTGDQRMVDTLHSDLRRARAAAVSMIPASTGAARAVGLVLPELDGKLDGTAVRVPTPNVSLIDLTFVAKRETTVEEINDAVVRAAEGRLKGVLGTVDVALVSIDFNHSPLSSAFDLTQTQVVDGTFVRVLSWYDNEWGFSNRMSDTAVALDGAG